MNDNEQQGSELGFFCCKGVQNWVNGPVSKFPKNIKVEEIVNKRIKGGCKGILVGDCNRQK